MKLYELAQEVRLLSDLINFQIDEDTGQLKEAHILEEIEREVKKKLIDKCEDILKLIKNKEAEISTLKNEEERLKKIRKFRENRLENLKEYIKNQMVSMETKKIETTLGSFNLRNSESVEVENIEILGEQFIKIKLEKSPDKTEIKKAIKNGENVAGAKLVSNVNLIIK